jgi:hypothetical protein
MQVVIVDQSAPESTLTDSDTDDTTSSAYTFSSLSFGAAATDRYIVVAVTYLGTSGGSQTTATIGGVSATTLIDRTVLSGGVTSGAAIITAPLPTGTTGDVVVNFSANMLDCAVSVYSVTGWLGSSSVTDGDDTGTISMSLTLPTNSTVIGVVGAIDDLSTDPTASATWTGLTERNDLSYDTGDAVYHTSASANFTAAQSPLSISCAHTSTNTGRRTGVAAGLYN